MATVWSDSYDDAPAMAKAPAMARPRRRWLWVVLVLVLGVLALPTMVGLTPLRNSAIALAAADLDGTVECGSLSLGWFSSIAADEVTIKGRDGKTVVQAAHLELPKSLLSLAVAPRSLGTIRIENPKLEIVLRDDGSNVEDLIAKLIARERPSGKPVAATIEISGGSASVEDVATRRRWNVTALAATIELTGDAAGSATAENSTAVRGKVTGELQADPDTPRFACDFELPRAEGERRQVKLAIKTDRLPLELCEPFARRWDKQFSLTGRLTADAAAEWPAQGAAGTTAVRGKVAAEVVRWRSAALGKDELRLQRLDAPVDMHWNGARLDVKDSSVTCDIGRVTVQGSAPVADLGFASLATALATASLEAAADVDLAPLSAMLPNTLRVRPDIRLVSGKLQAHFGRRADGNGQRSLGTIDIAQLAAEENGRRIAWNEPLHVAFNVSETSRGVVVNQLTCESAFLQVKGGGSLENFQADMTFDLDRLASELARFIDVRGVQLAGQGKGQLRGNRSPEGNVDAYGEFDIVGFRFALPGDRVWQEPNAKFRLAATGQLETGSVAAVANTAEPKTNRLRLVALHSATVGVESSGERLVVQLAKPVYKLTDQSAWPLAIRITDGNLANWSVRLRPWINLGAWHAAGMCNLTTTLTLSKEAIDINELNATLSDVAVGDQQRQWFADRELNVVASGRWDATPARIVVYRGRVRGAGLAADATESRIALDGSEAAGQASFDLDLKHASPWLLPLVAGATASGELSGRMFGAVQLDRQGDLTTFAAKVDGENLGVATRASGPARPGSMALVDRRLRVELQGSYDKNADVLKLDRGDATGEAVSIAATGTLTACRTKPEIDLSGKLDYDLDRLTPILQWYAGDGLRLTGRGPQTFAVRGPLDATLVTVAPITAGGKPASVPRWRQSLLADGAVGWQSFAWYGFRFGPGRLHARMADGRLVFDPLDVPLQEGRMTLAPQFYLTADPVAMALPKGQVLKDVRLTPDLCAAGLKYINPFLAGVTSVDGLVSLDLQGAWVPLSDPRQASLAGKMQIQRVEVSGGPLLGDVLPAILMLKPAKVPLLPDVEFYVQNGRVYHKGVGVQLRETTVVTTGSVGFDESLDLIAEMTVPEKWLGNNVLGSALKNQKIRIPIRGTLSQPRVDPQQLAKLRSEFVGEAAGNVIRDELLDRLFKPRPGQNPPPK